MYSNAALAMPKSSFDVGGERNRAVGVRRTVSCAGVNEVDRGGRSAIGSMATIRRTRDRRVATRPSGVPTLQGDRPTIAVLDGDYHESAPTPATTPVVAPAAQADDAPARACGCPTARRRTWNARPE